LSSQLEPSAYRAFAAKPGWSASSIEPAPGVHLNGLLRPPKSANAPWVLFYQGNDAKMLETGQAFLIRLAGDEDWGLATYAYRGYSSSSGTPRLDDLATDAAKILEQLCTAQNVPPSRVHLVGFSIGGHLATRAARAAALRSERAATLSLLASVDDIVMFRRSFWDKLDAGDDYQTRPLLGDVPAPVLVIQGTKDEALLGPEQGRAIAAALGERARYLELEGVGHSALLENDSAIKEVRAFIAGH